MMTNAVTLLTHPRMVPSYLGWLWGKWLSPPPVKRFPGPIRIAGFDSFSEYWSYQLPSPAEQRFFRAALAGGRVVLDVGANLGCYAAWIAREAPAARVYAFEPMPATFRRLADNLARNGCRAVTPVHAAAADRAGTVAFEAGGVSALSAICPDPAAAPGRTVEVPAVRLDDWCAAHQIGAVDLLKLDVEGAEVRALAGAGRLLEAGAVRWLFVEVSPANLRRFGHTVGDLVGLLTGYGYALRYLREDGGLGPPAAAADLAGVEVANLVAGRAGG